ncbi:hypothetical protein Sjap_008365 [Stephania japonica]|uniref:Uncharacterized protein n=1 Tax=Stephania japonica TaxID=461633 RepID=A0AAP0PED7_9MAGN
MHILEALEAAVSDGAGLARARNIFQFQRDFNEFGSEIECSLTRAENGSSKILANDEKDYRARAIAEEEDRAVFVGDKVEIGKGQKRPFFLWRTYLERMNKRENKAK